ncbi:MULTISPECIES: hypothetical protein [unclassified Haematospirillum]|uniref:hypothetical protein n=1 Tax=unclassified Haematospirillum TaxID=2622088 RepID=UPI001438DA7A|nr:MULTISPECIES: hypothetical protein [unclassified Haematospirillum]NKD55814.1 hypothetical protein [Haematospirillum sp. H4890]NKD75875.1 hypothetical protein [Haematospirillum sp. H4485]
MMTFGSSKRPGRLTRTATQDAPPRAGRQSVASLGAPRQARAVAATGKPRNTPRNTHQETASRATRESGQDRTSPITPPDRPEDLLMVVTELTRILDLENDALRKHRYGDVEEHSERKKALTRAYLEQIVVLHREPDIAKGMPQSQVEKLKVAGELLEQSSRLNESLLRAGIVAGNTFMGAVADAVREIQEKGQAAYGESGRLDGNQVENKRLAIALNKEF